MSDDEKKVANISPVAYDHITYLYNAEARYFERRWPRDFFLAAFMLLCSSSGVWNLTNDFINGQVGVYTLPIAVVVLFMWACAGVLVKYGITSRSRAATMRRQLVELAAKVRGEAVANPPPYRPWALDARTFLRTVRWAFPSVMACRRCNAPVVGPIKLHATPHAPDPFMASQSPHDAMKVQQGMAVAFSVGLVNKGFHVTGGIATGALCQRCFAELEPAARVPYYDALMDAWHPPAPPAMRRVIRDAVMAGR